MNLARLLTKTFTPTSPNDFCGPAHGAARIIDKLAGRPVIKLAFIGPPGTGKSTLVRYLAHRLGVLPFDWHKFAGRDVDLDRVRSIAETLQYAPAGPFKLIQIEEADGMTQAALQRMLTLLDELPPRTAFAITSNAALTQTEERFQTRFKVLEIDGPTPAELDAFLRSKAGPDVPAGPLSEIIKLADGNVRQAIDDLDTALLAA